MHTLNPRDGVKRSKQFLSESGLAAYLIKGNDAYNSNVTACKQMIHTLDPWDFFLLEYGNEHYISN